MVRRVLSGASLGAFALLAIWPHGAQAQYPPAPPVTEVSVLATQPTSTITAAAPTTTVGAGGSGVVTTTTKVAPPPSKVSTAARVSTVLTLVPTQLALTAPDNSANCRDLTIDAGGFRPGSDVVVHVGGQVLGVRADSKGIVLVTLAHICGVREGTKGTISGVDGRQIKRELPANVKGAVLRARDNQIGYTGFRVAIPLAMVGFSAIAVGLFLLLAARRRNEDEEQFPHRSKPTGPRPVTGRQS